MLRAVKPKFLAIEGEYQTDDGAITFTGETRGRKGAAITKSTDPRPTVILRSDTYFRDGEISALARIERKEAKVQFRLGASESSRIFFGLNIGPAAYGIALQQRGSPIQYLSTNGAGSSISTSEWLEIKAKVRGSEIELFVSGVLVAKAQTPIPYAQLEVVMSGLGKIQIKDVVISAQKPRAFVVMQFSPEYDALFNTVIKPTCEKFGYEVLRADNIYNNGLIIEDITNSIRECSVVIADITPNNPNVFYEVGYAHGISKPTILLSDKTRDRLPFDIAGVRTLFYDNTIAGKEVVEESLTRHLEALAT